MATHFILSLILPWRAFLPQPLGLHVELALFQVLSTSKPYRCTYC